MATTSVNLKTKENRQLRLYAIDPEERRRVWMKAWGIWKDKKPDPIQVLKKMRKEWERKTW